MAKQAKKTEAGYQKGENRGGKVIETYLYQDEHGKDYHLIEKTEHKQFPQKHWGVTDEDTGKTGWVAGAPKIKIPYQLPELLEAIKKGEPVFVCEGEKDADTVTRLGLCATTNSAGAGKWHKELAKWFKGCKVAYVLEDNDEDGYDHTETVAQALADIGVAKVFKLHFYDLQEKQDVTDWVKEYGGDKEKLLKRCATAEHYKVLMPIVIEGHNLPKAMQELEHALVGSKQPILSRGGELVQPVWRRHENVSKGKMYYTQTTEFYTLSEIELHKIARKHACKFFKFDGRAKKLMPCPPSIGLLQMVLANRHGPFPQVRSCINSPTLRPDGTILHEQGYDKATGLWHYCHDAAALPANMPKRPTKADAEKALVLIKDLYSETPFTNEIDRTVAVAAFITAVCRGAFVTAPLFLFTAPASGTGKSYMVDIISHATHGTWCTVINLAGPKEEREKRIGGVLLGGTNMISLDNLEGELNDIVLNQMLTQPIVNVRPLGRSEVLKCEWRGTIFATGNGVQLVRDLVRRGFTCNLNAHMADPETREFKYDPIEKVMTDRGKYIAAALTISRAYYFAKGVKKLQPIASFEEWSQFVRDPLVWLGEPDIKETQTEAKRQDPHRKAINEFISIWREGKILKPDTGYRVIDIIKRCDETMQDNDQLRNLLLSVAGSRGGSRQAIDNLRLGWWLRGLRDATFEGCSVTQGRQDKHGNVWILQQPANGLKAK